MLFYNTEDCLKIVEATERAIARLPKSVSIWVDKNVAILVDDHSPAYGIELDGHKRLVIVRRHAARMRYSLLETLIAHELAHCYLGHQSNGRYGRQEKSARRQTTKWGFDETALDAYIQAHQAQSSRSKGGA